MSAILSIIIMAVMAFAGFFVGVFYSHDIVGAVGFAILFALISGIGCIIQAINKKID